MRIPNGFELDKTTLKRVAYNIGFLKFRLDWKKEMKKKEGLWAPSDFEWIEWKLSWAVKAEAEAKAKAGRGSKASISGPKGRNKKSVEKLQPKR